MGLCSSRRFPAALVVCALAAGGALIPGGARSRCLEVPGDIAGNDATTGVVDVQCEILLALWEIAGGAGNPPGCLSVAIGDADLDCDASISVTDVVLLIGVALGNPWNPEIDADGNLCADKCELDSDGDGTMDVDDCAPHEPSVGPGRPEVCNGWDDDCDGALEVPSNPDVVSSCGEADVCTGPPSCGLPPGGVTIRINEVMVASQAKPGAAGQWIELHNSSGVAVKLAGWKLHLGSAGSMSIGGSSSLSIPPHGFVVLGRERDIAKNGGVVVDHAFPQFALDSMADTIALSNKKGLIDTFSYSPMSGILTEPGASMSLGSAPQQGGTVLAWAVSSALLPSGDRGTPHGPNVDVLVGTCVGGAPVTCHDGDPCTIDACVKPEGCAHYPGGGPCNDANACTPQDRCVPVSATSCAKLGWTTAGGSAEVCGASDAGLGGCSGEVTHSEAASLCAAAGARLCTVAELLADETKNTGCNYNTARVWSADPCGPGAAYSAAGSAGAAAGIPQKCSPGGSPGVYARCCADASPGSLSSGCTGGPLPLCDDGDPCSVDACVPGIGCQHTPGCSDGCSGPSELPTCGGCACEAEVCGFDPFCCEQAWDIICVEDCAKDAGGCGAYCGNGLCEPGESCAYCGVDCGQCPDPCCAAHTGAGCSESECEACVCASDAFCCQNQWDAACATAAAASCAGSCPCASVGDCCKPGAGCAQPACKDCVCGMDSFCCQVGWDLSCAMEAALLCGDACPCGGPPDNNCCSPHAGRGCELPACQFCMCVVDLPCCLTLWDASCAEQAKNVCGAACSCGNDLPSGGAGCNSSSSAGCAGCACEACVCAFSSSCCTLKWTPFCAELCEVGCGFGCE